MHTVQAYAVSSMLTAKALPPHPELAVSQLLIRGWTYKLLRRKEATAVRLSEPIRSESCRASRTNAVATARVGYL